MAASTVSTMSLVGMAQSLPNLQHGGQRIVHGWSVVPARKQNRLDAAQAQPVIDGDANGCGFTGNYILFTHSYYYMRYAEFVKEL